MTVRLAVTPDGRWGADAVEVVQACAAVGFAAVGVSAARGEASLAAAYRETGTECHEVLALVVGDDGAATMAAAESLRDVGVAMRATWVLSVFTGPVVGPVAEAVARAAAMFAEAGLGMAVEPSPLGAVPDLSSGLQVLDVAESQGGRAGLVIDAWHFCHSSSTWQDLERVPLERVAYLQFTDALVPDGRSAYRETTDRRALPGEGVLPLDRFASTFRDRGYDGLVSAEVLSAQLRSATAPALAAQLHASLSRYWA